MTKHNRRLPRRAFADIAPHVFSRFRAFHNENPHVFRLFKQRASEARSKGRRRFGAKAVMERLRWDLDFETTDERFKINNIFASCYSRLLIKEDCSFATFFQTRKSPGTISRLRQVSRR